MRSANDAAFSSRRNVALIDRPHLPRDDGPGKAIARRCVTRRAALGAELSVLKQRGERAAKLDRPARRDQPRTGLRDDVRQSDLRRHHD